MRSPALPMRQYGSFNPGEGLGGAAVHWSGQLWRFMESDFRHHSYIVDRYGEKRLPRGRRSRTGPVDYACSSPTTTRSSTTSAPRGPPGTCAGRSSPRGNPFEGPRSRPYPHPPLTTTASPTCSPRRAPSSGSTRSPSRRDPLARLDRPIRQRPAGMPVLRLLHPFRLRGRREVEPADDPSPRGPRHGTLRGAARLQGPADRDRGQRPRNRCHVCRPRRRGALPAGRTRRCLRVHAREQPPAAPLEGQRPIHAESATTGAASGGTTRTRSTRRQSPACSRARS